VSRQQPDPGTQIKVGDPVTIWVSTGDQVSMPDVIGQPEKQALAALGQAGLKTKVVRVRPDALPGLPKVDNGAVAQTDPKAGIDVPRGSTVTVVVVQDNAD
jgi:serine/threonine-protein kinase